MKFKFLSAALFLAATPAWAQSASTETVALKELDFSDILSKGDPIAIVPLGLLSVATVVLIFLYLLVIRRGTVVSDRFMDAAEAMIRKRDYLGLIAYCHRHNECIARVTHKTLDFLTKYPRASFFSVREVAEAEGSRQASLLTSRISYLADIGAIAPMVGLFGTVIGMIKAFIQISGGNAQGVRQMELATGVSEALLATALGLAIAIPALFFYAIFRSRVQKYISELEAAATHLIALINAEEETHPARHAPAGADAHLRGDHAHSLPTPLGREQRPDLHGI
ncbi:MAG: MotA/TolQ/ExbB proton channel family protein [Verrucomicrobiota bacterium]